MGVLHGAQNVPGESEHRRYGSGAPGHGIVEAFPVNPVTHPIGQAIDYAGVVNVAYGRVVESGQRFRFAQEPRAGGRCRVDLGPQADNIDLSEVQTWILIPRCSDHRSVFGRRSWSLEASSFTRAHRVEFTHPTTLEGSDLAITGPIPFLTSPYKDLRFT